MKTYQFDVQYADRKGTWIAIGESLTDAILNTIDIFPGISILGWRLQ